MPWEMMTSVVNLHVLNLGCFAFSGVSGLSARISTYLLRVTTVLPFCGLPCDVLIFTSSGFAATCFWTCASSLAP